MNKLTKRNQLPARASPGSDETANNHFGIISANVNGLRSKIAVVTTFILSYLPNVFCIQESKLDSNIVGNFDIPNYTCIRSDRSASGGGLCYYIQTILSHKIVTFPFIVTIELQAFLVTIDNTVLAICNAYRPPSSSVAEFVHVLADCISYVTTITDNIVLVGDLNICHLAPQSSSIVDMLKGFSLSQIIKHSTHLGKLLDVIYVSDTMATDYTSSTYAPIEKHHAVVGMTVKLPRSASLPKHKQPLYKIITFQYHKADWDAISVYLCSLNLVNVITSFAHVDIEHVIELINHAILTARALFVPSKSFTRRTDSPPWFTNELRLILKAKNNAYRLYACTKTKNPTVSVKHYNKYKSMQKLFRRKMATTKRSYLTDRLSTATNSSKFWATVKSAVTSSSRVPSSIMEMGTRYWMTVELPVPSPHILNLNSTPPLPHVPEGQVLEPSRWMTVTWRLPHPAFWGCVRVLPLGWMGYRRYFLKNVQPFLPLSYVH